MPLDRHFHQVPHHGYRAVAEPVTRRQVEPLASEPASPRSCWAAMSQEYKRH